MIGGVETLIPLYEDKTMIGRYTPSQLEAAFSKAITTHFGPSTRLEEGLINEKSCYKNLYRSSISDNGNRTILFQYIRYNPLQYQDDIIQAHITSLTGKELRKFQKKYPNLLERKITDDPLSLESLDEIETELQQQDLLLNRLRLGTEDGNCTTFAVLTDPESILRKLPITQWPERFSFAIMDKVSSAGKLHRSFSVDQMGAVNGVPALAYAALYRRLIIHNPPWETQIADDLPEGIELNFPSLLSNLWLAEKIAFDNFPSDIAEKVRTGKIRQAIVNHSYYKGKAPTLLIRTYGENKAEQFMNKFVKLTKALSQQI